MSESKSDSIIVKVGYVLCVLMLFIALYPSISGFMSGVGAGFFDGLNN